MQKKFITNLALVLFLNILVKPFYILGIDAEILKQVKAVSPGDYGEYFSLIGFTFICNIFLDLGIINFNTRNIAQNQQLLKKHFAGIITLRGILSLGYMGILLIGGLLLGYTELQFKLLGILGLNQVLVSFILYFRSNLSGLLLFKQDSFISVLDRILLIGICSVLLWGGVTDTHFKIEWFVYAQTAAYGITALVAAFLTIRQTGKVKITWNKPFSFLILKQSVPYALLILLMMIYYRSDSVMLERMLDNGGEEATLYAQGFRFFEAVNMVGFLFAGLLLPLFSRMIKNGQNVSKIVYTSFKIIFTGALTVSMCGVVYAEDIMAWRYGGSAEEIYQSSRAFEMLMWCFIGNSTTYIFGTLLTANGSLKPLNYMASAGVILNVVLNVILIPKYGAYGAAIASLITQGLTALSQLIMSFVILRIHVSLKVILQFIAFIGFMIMAKKLIPYLELDWPLSLLLLFSTGGAFAFITGMFSLQGLKKIMREKTG